MKNMEAVLGEIKSNVVDFEKAKGYGPALVPESAPEKKRQARWSGIGLAMTRQHQGAALAKLRVEKPAAEAVEGRKPWSGIGLALARTHAGTEIARLRARVAELEQQLADERAGADRKATAYAARTANGRIPSIFSF